jgi:hypothetical protein
VDDDPRLDARLDGKDGVGRTIGGHAALFGMSEGLPLREDRDVGDDLPRRAAGVDDECRAGNRDIADAAAAGRCVSVGVVAATAPQVPAGRRRVDREHQGQYTHDENTHPASHGVTSMKAENDQGER